MNIFNQVPFFRLLLPFLAGILAAVYSGLQFAFFNYITLGLFAVIALFAFIKRLNFSYKYSWPFGVIATLILFIIGFQLTVLNTDRFKKDHFSRTSPDAALYLVRISSTILEKEKSYKVPVEVTSVKENGLWRSVSGKAMCYFKKDSISKKIRYGDVLLVKTKFTEIKPPQNPSEFNYKRFLAFHNIYHQAYIPTENRKHTDRNEGNRIISASYAIREYLLNIYRQNNITGDEFAVGSALVLGYTDELDQDIISAYASSGALHVLSVSGLHVGIIYLIFNYLMFFLDKFKYGKFIKMTLLLFILWSYATLTGLSPSVLRSAAMFSFIVIARTWRYNTNIFNTLAVSCFVLLLYNPYLIMEVGFQLSYLAVLGIVAIQPWLYEKWQPKAWLVDQIWMITSVSIAAQLATFPLGLLYFHQFPNYFLFSNLIVIPASTLILGYGLLFFILGKISSIALFCGKIFSGLVWFLNESVRMVDQTPGALIQGISISIAETWIIYALVVLLIVFFYRKQVKYLLTSLTAIILLLSLEVVEARVVSTQKEIVVYDIAKTSAYDFISGRETVLLADSSLVNNPAAMLFHIRHNWWNRQVSQQKTISTANLQDLRNPDIRIRGNFIQFAGKRIAIIRSKPAVYSGRNIRLRVDLIILSENANISVEELKKYYDFKKVIADSSNRQWRNALWKKQCEELRIDFYSVIDSGAYIEEL